MTEIIEVHNAWTIYGMDDENTVAEQPFASVARPQDWGHPRWVYNRFRFEWITDEKHYINHCHCWTDLQLEQPEYPILFASLITKILIPGRQAELCGRDYLEEDDFWSSKWGEMPPVFEPDDFEGRPFYIPPD